MTSKHGWTCAIVLVTAALAAPAAHARHAPDDVATPSQSPTTFAVDDRLGPKYVRIAKSSPAPLPVRTVEVVKPSSFAWRDALIGSGVTAFAIALLGAVVLGVTRRREPATSRAAAAR